MIKTEDVSNSNLCAWNMFYESILLAILLTPIEQFGDWSSAICLMFGQRPLLPMQFHHSNEFAATNYFKQKNIELTIVPKEEHKSEKRTRKKKIQRVCHRTNKYFCNKVTQKKKKNRKWKSWKENGMSTHCCGGCV